MDGIEGFDWSGVSDCGSNMNKIKKSIVDKFIYFSLGIKIFIHQIASLICYLDESILPCP